jgi:hypothetical protein
MLTYICGYTTKWSHAAAGNMDFLGRTSRSQETTAWVGDTGIFALRTDCASPRSAKEIKVTHKKIQCLNTHFKYIVFHAYHYKGGRS